MRIHEVPLEDCAGVLGEVMPDMFVQEEFVSRLYSWTGNRVQVKSRNSPPRPGERVSAKPDKIAAIINYFKGIRVRDQQNNVSISL